MTRWFVAWALALLVVAMFGHVAGIAWLTFIPVVLPLIYADQYVRVHYPQEEL